jgi:ABC-type transport system involved in multi-copper enzyme maturation permease subunit
LSPASEIRLIVFREIRRSVRSVKGIVLGVLTLIGAFVASLVCVLIEGKDRETVQAASNEAFIEMKKQAFEQATGNAQLAAQLATIPNSLLVFLKITVWLAPLLIALLGFDLVSGELQHRSARFWTVRTRRWSYFTGKMIGLWVLIGLITLVVNAIADTVALARGYVTIGQLATWGVRFWLVAFVIAGAWAAIATFISSCFKTPMLALLTTFGAFFVLWLLGVGGFIERIKDMATTHVTNPMSWYEYLYPNSYDELLLSPETTRVLTALGVLIGFVVLTNAAGAALFQRRDI